MHPPAVISPASFVVGKNSHQQSRQLKSLTPGEYIMRIVYLACTLILLAAVLFCRIDGAAAQGSDAVRQACTPDAMRLCSDVIPDVPKVTACMKAKSSQLSEACRVAMRGESRTTRVRHHRGHYHHYRHCHHCG
jgi:hypothetical protein